ncbi:MAG TPA: hypothetical protein VK737_12580, partial [Opitutales bacterium]|nr:hypothetical protein [Opitutales bacterium]
MLAPCMVAGKLPHWARRAHRTLLGLVAAAALTVAASAQTAPAAAPTGMTAPVRATGAGATSMSTSGRRTIQRFNADGTTYEEDISDYLPDLSQGDTITAGQVGAFYRGAFLTFMLLVLAGLLLRSRQQAKHVKELQRQAKELATGSKLNERDFSRRQHLHFENTPLAVVELDSQRRMKEWTGRA